MAKYSDLKLKINKEYKEFELNGNIIKVKQYLPADEKYDLIMVTLQESAEGDIYNPYRLDLYFNMNLIFLYSDIEFDADDRADVTKLYSELDSNGVVDKIISLIPDLEYNFLKETLAELVDMNMEYKTRIGVSLKDIVADLPKQMEAAGKIVENFKPEDYQAVIDFATAANGGRSIFTNQPVEKAEEE